MKTKQQFEFVPSWEFVTKCTTNGSFLIRTMTMKRWKSQSGRKEQKQKKHQMVARKTKKNKFSCECKCDKTEKGELLVNDVFHLVELEDIRSAKRENQ